MTSTLVWRRVLRIIFHVCLYINQYSLHFNPYSKFYFLSKLTKNTWRLGGKKEGNRNTKKPLVKEWTHKGEKNKQKKQNAMTRYKQILHHWRLTKQQNRRAKTQVVFYTFLSLSNNMAHRSTLLPYIWVCKLYCFPHRGKKERKRCSFHESHVCLDCPQKRSASRKIARRKRIYNHSVKRHHPLLERNWESITRSWKDSEPASNWCSEYLCDSVCTWTVQMCLWLSQLLFVVFSLILRPSYPVLLRPAGSSCGRWAADGPLYWRPSPPVGGGRHRRRAGTDTWANRKSAI